MILKDLEYICEVARQGTLSEAAKNLSISQPALSLFVSNLETELGIRLFTRKKTAFRLLQKEKSMCKLLLKCWMCATACMHSCMP